MDVRERLLQSLHADRLARLGFRADDVEDAGRELGALARDGAALQRIELLATRLAAGVGGPVPGAGEEYAALDGALGRDDGPVAMAALLVTVENVRAFHRDRGIPDAVSWATLADLGRQVWVHRQTFDSFGLHTQSWLQIAWAGHLYALGRLQFNLHRVPADPYAGVLVLSTHIPQSGPLDPASVDASIARARPFFAAHFPRARPEFLHCMSWLLDPQLADALPGSNIAEFQRRWELFGAPLPGLADAVFFTFRRRGPVAPDELVGGSRLATLVRDRVRSGPPLHLRHGRLAFPHR